VQPEIHRRPGRLPVEAYVEGVRRGDRAILARAITLIESERQDDAEPAAQLLDAILPHTGGARRVAITGVPGVGKSTLIDTLGLHLVRDRGEQVAVLSVDPSSPVSGGSLLGDKTRMARLAVEPDAFVRPSPARGHLGGVAPRTREAIQLCEAAGYQTVIVETVGVGQSEIAVREMTDCFVLLLLAGAGDELQGLKRGIVEMADILAITKADGDNREPAARARAAYAGALHLFPPTPERWTPPVLTTSALEGEGIADLWAAVLAHQAHLEAGGFRVARRRDQAVAWMRELVTIGLGRALARDAAVAGAVATFESRVATFEISPIAASNEIVRRFLHKG
jgi:LAO/AO transport system kinase